MILPLTKSRVEFLLSFQRLCDIRVVWRPSCPHAADFQCLFCKWRGEAPYFWQPIRHGHRRASDIFRAHGWL